jgi:putative addiction module component (TIGR02574 family)
MNELVLEISKLSVFDRILLVQEILQTISSEPKMHDMPNAAQIQELEARSKSIQEGTVNLVSWSSMKEKLQMRYETN